MINLARQFHLTSPVDGAFFDTVMPIRIVLPGEPVAFARMRVSKAGKFFMPEKQRNMVATLRMAAIEAMRGKAPFDEALWVDIVVEKQPPASWSQRKTLKALAGELHPQGRPDLSNFLKLAEDALNSIVWRDDALIVELSAIKRYASLSRLVITVEPIKVALGGMAVPTEGLSVTRGDRGTVARTTQAKADEHANTRTPQT